MEQNIFLKYIHLSVSRNSACTASLTLLVFLVLFNFQVFETEPFISLWGKQTENQQFHHKLVHPMILILCSYKQEQSCSFCTNMERVLRSIFWVRKSKGKYEYIFVFACFCINSRRIYKKLHTVVVFGPEEGNEADGRQGQK